MKVKIRTKDIHFSMPVPLTMIGFVIKMIPDKTFEKMSANTPAPYCDLITKENACTVLLECIDVLKENKGLEIVHVEETDGTFISIRL